MIKTKGEYCRITDVLGMFGGMSLEMPDDTKKVKDTDAIDVANELGEEGWELVSFHANMAAARESVWIFKRPIN